MEKYIEIFNKLWEHSENEVVEFKKAETNFDIDELGKYFSALSNEANLRDHEFAWIVFGVWDKKHQIIGTTFKDGEVALNRLKQDMSQHTTDNLIFRDIVPIEVEGKRVLLFQVPASPRNIVMHWKGVAYGRDGESLKPCSARNEKAQLRLCFFAFCFCQYFLHKYILLSVISLYVLCALYQGAQGFSPKKL